MTLLRRLQWLVPLPRIHLTRSHGVFAPAHPWRARVVPSEPRVEAPLSCLRKSRWIDWADLLKRVFAIEVLVLRLSKDVCGGRRRVIAVIKDEKVTRKILAHLGLPDEAPRLAPAAEVPQGDWWPTGPPRDEYAQPPASFESLRMEYDQRWGTIDVAE